MLWELYFERLARVAHPIVRFGPMARGTEEDAALSAIDAFCNGIAKGEFTYVDGREVLWGTLAKITERKAMQQRPAIRKRRSRSKISHRRRPRDDGAGQLAIVEPTPEYKASSTWCWLN